MSEISITRFQPAAISRDSSTSVQAVDELSGAPKSDSSTDQKKSGQERDQSSQKSPYQQAQQDMSAASSDDAASVNAAEANKLEQAVSKLNEYVQTVQRDIYFDLDPLSGEPSVTVLDRESRQVLRQFDSQEALELAGKVDSDEPISLFKTQV